MLPLGELASVVGMLLAIALVLFAAYWCTQRIAVSSVGKIGVRGRQMKIIDRLPLGQNKMLTVVSVGGRYLLLGVANEQITLLCELTEAEAACWSQMPQEDGQEVPRFSDIIAQALRSRNKKDR